MALYTEEQLSMILSAHEAGQLMQGGSYDFGFHIKGSIGYGCINQIAFNMYDSGNAKYGIGPAAQRAGCWFDDEYQHEMSIGKLLRALESF